jgi:hypothetical protein
MNGVPTDASSALASIVVSNVSSATGHLEVHPTGQAAPAPWSMNWNSTQNSEWTSGVKLGTDGFVTVNVTAGGPVSISVGVQGYFTAAPGSAAFTPAHSRVYDSRQGAGATAIPAGGERSVAVSGVGGIPAFGSGINALAMNVIMVSGNGQGHLKMWADDTTLPGEDVQQLYENCITYGFTAVRVGSGGGVTIRNNSSAPVHVIIDAEGWWSGLQAGPDTTNLTGGRPSQTTMPFGVSDHVQGSVDVATGNFQLNTAGLSLPGVTGQASTNASYNSRLVQRDRDLTPAANRWVHGYAGTGQLVANDTGITYLGTVCEMTR